MRSSILFDMRSSILFAAFFLISGYTARSLAEEAPHPADEVQAAFDKFVQATSHSNRRTQCNARKALVSLGPIVVAELTESARGHSELRVRRACYEVLTSSFAEDERTVNALLQNGLLNQDPDIRYQAAIHLGDFKVQRAEQALRAAFEGATGKDEQFIRFALAKSLAQLGKADVLPVLMAAVSHDLFESRRLGNIGLKALTGKSLGDFAGYSCSEGAVIFGGKEPLLPDALALAERKAWRFRAGEAYLKWLKEERPELYTFAKCRPHPPIDSNPP